MDTQKAIQVLIQGCQIAQAKGAFTLDDAVIVKQAIDVFLKPSVEPKTPPESDLNSKEVSDTTSEKTDA